MDRLRRAAEMIKSNPYQSALKNEDFSKRQEKLSQINSLLMSLTNHEAMESKEFPVLLTSSLEILFNSLDDEDSSVRLSADTTLIQAIKTLRENHSSRILVELKKAIKQNQSPRVLKTALLRFAELSHLIRPQKRRLFVQSLLYAIEMVAGREEEMVHESLAIFMAKTMPHLGSFILRKEVEVLIVTFVNLLSSKSGTIRRSAATSLASIVGNSYDPQLCLVATVELTLDRLEFEVTPRDGRPVQSPLVLVGYLECLKALFKLKIPCEGFSEHLNLRAYTILHQIIVKNDHSLTSALETLQALLRVGLRMSQSANGIGNAETRSALMQDLPKLLGEILSGQLVPVSSPTSARSSASSCLVSCLEFGVGTEDCFELIQAMTMEDDPELQSLVVQLAGAILSNDELPTEWCEGLLSVIKKGLCSSSAGCLRSSLQSLVKCIPSLLDCPEIHLSDFFDALRKLSENPYWLVKCAVLEVVEKLDFIKIFHFTQDEGIQNSMMDVIYHLLEDEDSRVRAAASSTLVRLIPKLFHPELGIDNLLAVLIACMNRKEGSAFPDLTARVTELHSYLALSEVHENTERCLTHVLQELRLRVSVVDEKGALEGIIQSLYDLSASYPPCAYTLAWFDDPAILSIIYEISTAHPIAENISAFSHLLTLAGRLLAGYAPFDFPSSSADSLFEKVRSGLVSTVVRILSVYHAVYEDNTASYGTSKAATFPRQILSPTRKRATLHERDKSNDRKSPGSQYSGNFWSQTYFVRLYENVRSLWKNSRLSYENASEDKFLGLLRASLELFSLLCEVSPSNQMSRHYEEILIYLKSCTSFLPSHAVYAVSQLLKCMFGSTFLSELKQEDISVMKDLLSKRETKADARSRGSPSSPSVRCNSEPANQHRIVEKSLLTATIIQFEPIVKRVLALYTTTSDTLVQIQVLHLVKHLVTLGLNYTLLDPDQVFLKHITQQLEFLQDGWIPDVEDFLKAVFTFLFSLCKAKTDSPKPVLAVTRAVQLWRILTENSKMRTYALRAGIPVVLALFNKEPRINAETESCRKIVLQLLTTCSIDHEVAKLLLLILENQKESKTPEYRDLSEVVHAKLLEDETLFVSSDPVVSELFHALDSAVYSVLPVKQLQELSAAASEDPVRCCYRLGILIEEVFQCIKSGEAHSTELQECFRFIVSSLSSILIEGCYRKKNDQNIQFLESVSYQLKKIGTSKTNPHMVQELGQSIHLISNSFARTGSLDIDSLLLEIAKGISFTLTAFDSLVGRKSFYHEMCKVLMVLYLSEIESTGLEQLSGLETYVFELCGTASVLSCMEKLLSDSHLPAFSNRIKELCAQDNSLLRKVAVSVMNCYNRSRATEIIDLMSQIYSSADVCLQRYIECKMEQKFFLSLLTDESEVPEAGSLLVQNIRRKKVASKPSIMSLPNLVTRLGFIDTPEFCDLKNLQTFISELDGPVMPSTIASLCRTEFPLEFLQSLVETALEMCLEKKNVGDMLYLFEGVNHLGARSSDIQNLVRRCLECQSIIFEDLLSLPTANVIKPLETTIKLIALAMKLEMDSDLQKKVLDMVRFLVSQFSRFYLIDNKADTENAVKEVLRVLTKDPVLKRMPSSLALLCRKLLIIIVRTGFHSEVVAPHEDGASRDNRLSPSSVHVLQDEEVINGFNERLMMFGWKNRLGFEEYWMTYLSVLNANMSIDVLNNDEAKAIVKVTCEVVKGIVCLLLQSFLIPLPGNPAVSEYLHESREVPSAFLETRQGEKLAKLLKALPLRMTLDRNVERTESEISYSLSQVSVKFLRAAILANDITGADDSPPVLVDSPTYVEHQTALQNSALDVRSCIHFLLDLYQQWLDQEMSFELRFQLVKSILPLSDLFCERSQYDWMYKVFFKLLKKYDGDEAVCLPYLWVGLAKCAAILPPDSVHWDELRKQLSLAMNTTFPKTQIYVLHGLLYILQAPDGPYGNIIAMAADYLLRYLPNQVASVLSGSMSMSEEVLIWFSLGFHLAGYHREQIANFDVVGTVLNQAVTCLFSEKISSALRNGLIMGIYHLSTSGLSQTCYRLLGNYAKKCLKSSNSNVFVSGTQLLLISYYTGIHFCSSQDETDEINLLAMECIGLLFDRLKTGFSTEAKVISTFLGDWLCEVLTVDMALNRTICEFSLVDESRRLEMAQILRQVFTYALENEQQQKAFDWVCFGSDSLLKKNSLWYMTCALILSSPNDIIRNIDVKNLHDDCNDVLQLVIEEFRSEETEEQVSRLVELTGSKLILS